MIEVSKSRSPGRPILPEWFDTEPGQALIVEQKRALETMLPDQFYRVGLQFGLPPHAIMQNLNVEQAIYCDTGSVSGTESAINMIALPEALPLAESSLDFALLVHTLDYCQDPHRVLREFSEVLSPEGVLVLVGFHPFSLWGARRRFSKKQAPLNARFIARNVVQDRLELLGFKPLAGCMFNYQFPQLNSQWRDRLGWMNKMGDRWWPTLGAVYILVVQKKIYSGLGVKSVRKQGKRWFSELKPAQAKIAQSSELKQ